MANHFIDNFLKNLNTSESAVITRYLKSNITNAEESKTLEVFRQLNSGETIGYANKTAFNKMKSRIFEKSLDALMMDEQYLSEVFCEFDYKLLELKKKLVKVRILLLSMTQHKTDTIQHLLHEIIEEAKQYELYPILNEALIIKKYMIITRTNISELEQINKEIIFYKFCENSFYDAVDRYHTLTRNGGINFQLTKKETCKHIADSIKHLEKSFNNTKSRQIHYYLIIMKFAFQEEKRNYDECIALCHTLINFLQKNKSMFRNERIGFAHDNLSLYYLLSNNYKMAEEHVNKAQNFFLPGSHNSMVCQEAKFHIFFHQKKYKEAIDCLETLINHSLNDAGKFRNGKFIFYKINCFFVEKKFKECIQLVNKPLEIEKGKSTWRIALGILNIMTSIELAHFDRASRKLDSIRKYIERSKSDGKIKERDLLIVKALRELEKNSFEVDSQNIALAKIIKKLTAKNTSVSWEHFTPELIPFHEWLGERISS